MLWLYKLNQILQGCLMKWILNQLNLYGNTGLFTYHWPIIMIKNTFKSTINVLKINIHIVFTKVKVFYL